MKKLHGIRSFVKEANNTESDIPIEVVIRDGTKLNITIVAPKRENGDVRVLSNSIAFHKRNMKVIKNITAISIGIAMGLCIFPLGIVLPWMFMLFAAISVCFYQFEKILLYKEFMNNQEQISRDMAETILLQEDQLGEYALKSITQDNDMRKLMVENHALRMALWVKRQTKP